MSTTGKVIVTILVGLLAVLLIAIIPWKVPTSVITGGLYCGILKNVWEK